MVVHCRGWVAEGNGGGEDSDRVEDGDSPGVQHGLQLDQLHQLESHSSASSAAVQAVTNIDSYVGIFQNIGYLSALVSYLLEQLLNRQCHWSLLCEWHSYILPQKEGL